MLQHRLLLLVTLATAACDGGDSSGPSSGTESSGGGIATGGTGGIATGGSGGTATGGTGGIATGGTGGSGGGPSGPSVTGMLEDEMAQPIGGADVLCCSLSVCYSSYSDAEGHFAFSFEAELPVDFVVKSLENAETTPRRAATLFPLHFIDTVPIDAGKLFVPSLPAGAILGPTSSDPQTLEVGDGLQLIVSRADLVAPLGGFLGDLAARRIPPEHVPPLPELGAEEVLAVYALYPFATASESPIGIRAPSDLPAGTPVSFRSISEYDGKLSAPAPGQADGTQVKTDVLAGIEELTWLVISKQP